MNQIACAMLDENLFIINDVSNKRMNSARIQNLISMCIKFNELILPELCIHTYKGIIMFKTTKNMCNYIVIDVIINKNTVKDTIISLSKLSLVDEHSTHEHSTHEHSTRQYNLMELLETGINDLYKSNIIECYDSLYNGKKYDYAINNRVKIDLDVINNNFLNIKDTSPLDHIKLKIKL